MHRIMLIEACQKDFSKVTWFLLGSAWLQSSAVWIEYWYVLPAKYQNYRQHQKSRWKKFSLNFWHNETVESSSSLCSSITCFTFQWHKAIILSSTKSNQIDPAAISVIFEGSWYKFWWFMMPKMLWVSMVLFI